MQTFNDMQAPYTPALAVAVIIRWVQGTGGSTMVVTTEGILVQDTIGAEEYTSMGDSPDGGIPTPRSGAAIIGAFLLLPCGFTWVDPPTMTLMESISDKRKTNTK